MNAALLTIGNHIENIDMMIKAYDWGKPIEECFKEIEKSVEVIHVQIDFLKKEAA